MEEFAPTGESASIDTRELLLMAKRNVLPIVVCFIVCVSISAVVYKSVPKRFKAMSVLNIQASYFQTPLVEISFPKFLTKES